MPLIVLKKESPTRGVSGEIEKMSKDLGVKILVGAGYDVDQIAKNVKDKYGMDKLKELVKLNFKNTEKIQ